LVPNTFAAPVLGGYKRQEQDNRPPAVIIAIPMIHIHGSKKNSKLKDPVLVCNHPWLSNFWGKKIQRTEHETTS
jgi:hypothetical protein